jgi:hypothetical protein
MSKQSLLIQLSHAVADLSSALDDDLDLTREEQIFIENHLLMLRTSYAKWKGRKREKALADS